VFTNRRSTFRADLWPDSIRASLSTIDPPAVRGPRLPHYESVEMGPDNPGRPATWQLVRSLHLEREILDLRGLGGPHGPAAGAPQTFKIEGVQFRSAEKPCTKHMSVLTCFHQLSKVRRGVIRAINWSLLALSKLDYEWVPKLSASSPVFYCVQ
jgi:hypothetical protein